MRDFALKFLALLLLVAGAAPASASWREASSPHFVIYSEASETKLRQFAERLERYDAAMRHLRQLPPHDPGAANRLTVFVVDDAADVRALLTRGGRNIAGFYIPRAGGSIAVVPGRGLGDAKFGLDAETILLHEYAHHFMFENFPGAFPAWFVEGFAEFHSTVKFNADGGIGIGLPATHRALGLLRGVPLPAAKLVAADPGTFNEDQKSAMYNRGWLLTHYLTFSPTRRGQLAQYLKAIQTGKAPTAAASDAFGDLKALDKELDRYMLSRRMSYIDLAPGAIKAAPVSIRTLSAAETAIMPIRIRSKVGVNRTSALQLLPKARKAAAPFPNDPAAQTALAEAEFDAGHWAEAEAAADRALVTNPQHTVALLYKGRARMERARAAGAKDDATWKDVRRWFLAANKADPDHPEPLIHYHNAFLAAGAAPPKQAVDGLLAAHSFAPQDRRLRMAVARQLLVDGRTDEARGLLAMIAYDPHSGRAGPLATALIALLDQKGAAAAAGSIQATELPDEAEEGDPAG